MKTTFHLLKIVIAQVLLSCKLEWQNMFDFSVHEAMLQKM